MSRIHFKSFFFLGSRASSEKILTEGVIFEYEEVFRPWTRTEGVVRPYTRCRRSAVGNNDGNKRSCGGSGAAFCSGGSSACKRAVRKRSYGSKKQWDVHRLQEGPVHYKRPHGGLHSLRSWRNRRRQRPGNRVRSVFRGERTLAISLLIIRRRPFKLQLNSCCTCQCHRWRDTC